MLKKNEKRLLKLLLEQNNFVPASFFQKELNVSTKTIYSYLKNIEMELKLYQLNILKIPRKGILLEGKKENKNKAYQLLLDSSVIDYTTYSPNYRKLKIFASIIFNKLQPSYQKIADKYYVSISSVKKDIEDIEIFINNYDTSLNDIKMNQVPESKIQKIFKSFLEYYTKKESLSKDTLISIFSKELYIEINRYVEERAEIERINLSDYIKESLLYSLLIFFKRIQLDCHIEKENNLMSMDIQNMTLYMSAVQLSDKMSSKFKLEVHTTDLQYLSSLLFVHGIEPIANNAQIGQEFFNEITNLISQMSNLLDVSLENDQLLSQSLLAHIVPMVYRLKNNIHIRNPLIDRIKKQYSTMYTLLKFAINDLETAFAIHLTEDEISFLTIHFQLAFEKMSSSKHILIVCSSGFVTSELIRNRIQNSVSKNIILEISTLSQLFQSNLNQVDLIVSTIPLTNYSLNTRILYVSPIPSAADMNNILLLINELDQKQKNFSEKEAQDYQLLVKYIDPDLIFIKETISNAGEALLFLSKKYTDLDYVQNAFASSLFKREELGSTGLKSGVAFPHADPKTIKQTKIAILTTEKPIQWGDSTVSIIVLAAISENDMDIAKDLISTIYEWLKDTESVKDVSSSTNKKILLQKLLKRR